MLFVGGVLSLLLARVGGIAIELTDGNFKKSVDGKNALLWFHAPW
jgi:hypothetical protein